MAEWKREQGYDHGDYYELAYCSECEEITPAGDYMWRRRTPYCPFCGARMEDVPLGDYIDGWREDK